jgi:hypothetical protein
VYRCCSRWLIGARMRDHHVPGLEKAVMVVSTTASSSRHSTQNLSSPCSGVAPGS